MLVLLQGRIGAQGVIRHLNQSDNSNCLAILSHSELRRPSVSEGCFVFTVKLLERRQILPVDQIALLREAGATTRRSHPFTISSQPMRACWGYERTEGDLREYQIRPAPTSTLAMP